MEVGLKSDRTNREVWDTYQPTLPMGFPEIEQYLSKVNPTQTKSRNYNSRSFFSSFSLLLILLLVVSSNVPAEVYKGESPNSTSEVGSMDAQQPNQSCRVDDPVANLSKQQKEEEIHSPYRAYQVSERDRRCIADPETIRSKWHTGMITLIDVRSVQAFRAGSIPGSINIPEYSIRTKRFLKQKTLVLINDGLSNLSLIQTCQRLRKSGFRNVSVLSGGIYAWLENDVPIERQLIGSLDSVLAPRDLVRSQSEIAWLFLTDASDIASVKQVLRSDEVLPIASPMEEIVGRLNKIAEPGSSIAPVHIAILTESSTFSESSKLFQSERISNPIFVIEGGLSGYKQYAASHALQTAKIERGPNIHGGCSS